jgi:hypothetical protein
MKIELGNRRDHAWFSGCREVPTGGGASKLRRSSRPRTRLVAARAARLRVSISAARR